jgi:hypothetical protein
VLLLSGPGATLTIDRLVILSTDKNTLDELVDGLERHEDREVVEERSGGRVASRGQVNMVGGDVRECLFRVKSLVLFALETALGGIRVTGKMVTACVGVVGPKRKLFGARSGSLLDCVLGEESDQGVQVLIVNAGFTT